MGTTDDRHYEVIEVDEEDLDNTEQEDTQPNVSNSELAESYENEIDNDDGSPSYESSNIALDRRKVFVLESTTPNDNLSSTISVVYECHICYDTFDSMALSEQHMKRFHAPEKESKGDDDTIEHVTCPICSSSFDNGNSLDQHLEEKHSHDNDIVDEEFRYESDDMNLADVVEVDETTNTIQDECDDGHEIVTDEHSTNEVKTPVILMSTNESMDTELKFNCEKCGGKFAKERSLNIHIKLNKCTVKSFECSTCKKVFVRKKNLDSHMKTHNELNDYSCKVCSEKFTRADKLAIHVQTQHEPSRKYLCPYCWKGKFII